MTGTSLRCLVVADTSVAGVRESATLMVNYVYDPSRIEECHEVYVGGGRRTASTTVRRLARGWGRAADLNGGMRG